ncbi:MAG: response regulator [Candidatus Marinimicrobia bacterium]|nr:response regulator [Candidatus Neomarinimicrobiota bacterium]
MTEPKKVLLVEDEVITASSLKMGLEELGYLVCPLATRADRALIIAEQEHPDVVLMDVNLPGGMNGIDTAKKILELMDTKILFLTGYHDDDVIARINAIKPLGYLVKPISALRIKDMLDKHL